MEKLRRAPRRIWALAAVVVGGVVLTGCQVPSFGAHPSISKQGSDSLKLWQGFFIAGCVVFLIVFALIVWSIFRYKRRSDQIPPQTQYHTLTEILYTVIPLVIVAILFGFTFVTENNVDANPTPQVNVTVTAFQWGWTFTYPGKDVRVIGVETQRPEMVLPENETVRITLKSADVIHGFYVPAFDYSEYAQPGHTNMLTVNLNKTGIFRGQCTQFCGLYHSLMQFRVKVVTPSQFSTWLTSQHGSARSPVGIATAKNEIKSGTASTYGSTGGSS